VPKFDFQCNFFFIEEYQFRGTLFVIDIFGYHQFLSHFITKMIPTLQTHPCSGPVLALYGIAVQFLTACHYTNSKNSIISFEHVDCEAKIFLILYPCLKTRQPVLQNPAQRINCETSLIHRRICQLEIHDSIYTPTLIQ
jgi:hypothetical protein